MGIKETLELLDGIEILGIFGGRVLKDGKINIRDLQELSYLFNKRNELIKAAEGINEIKAELGDLTAEEVAEIIERLYKLVNNVVKEIK